MSEDVEREPKFNVLLQCGLLEEGVFGGTVRLWLLENHCVDMCGAIKYARKLNPDVKRIETFSGGVRDAFYKYMTENDEFETWVVFDYEEPYPCRGKRRINKDRWDD